MSALALESQGTKLEIGIGTPVVYERICEIKTFSGPGGSATVIDTTDLCDTAKTKRMGLADEGQLSFTINYIPADTAHAELRAARASRELTLFKLTFTDTPATVWEFAGFVAGFSLSGAVDGVIEATVTVEISGEITES
jgi:hypothetical protein